MKHVVYTILFTLLTVQVFSQEVDEKAARIVAEHFFLKNYGTNASVENVLVKQYKGHESLFFCNMDKGGWVAVPANRNLNPVVAHSDEGTIVLNEGPDVFWDWMEQYEYLVDVAITEKWEKIEKQQKWMTLITKESQEPLLKSNINKTFLLKSKWGQGRTKDWQCPGYNSYIPLSEYGCSCDRCSAGCVPVAIGQIMNYWGYSTGDYACFDWWNMPDSLMSSSINFANEQQAVAYLLKRIGDRIGMDYCHGNTDQNSDTCSSSGEAENADYALEKFGYKDNMDYKRKSLNTYNSWVNILKDEIIAERPILYRYIGKHSFVCDGYDSANDNFHFNFGWNGSYNSWVDFEDIDDIENCVPCENYSNLFKHACWINIKPDVSNIITLTNKTILTSSSDTWATNKTYQAKSAILVAGNNTSFEILDSASCRFVAGDSIVLKPGFHAHQGTNLLCKPFKKSNLKSEYLLEYEELENLDEFTSSMSNDILLYPNPAENELIISYDKTLYDIKIFSNIGVEIDYVRFCNGKTNIDISKYPKGLYIVNIKINNKIYSKSFVKQ